ncbi:MAG: GNAT family N-acetyltransferase [Aggregatilineales bacterium]
MLIRLFEERDVAVCAAIMAATPLWQRYGVTVQSAAERLNAGLRRMHEPDAESSATRLFVAESESGAAIGFVWAVRRGAFDRSGYIPLLAVESSQRGGGVGLALLTAAEDYLRPAPDVILLCTDYNTGAQRFYERHGYVRVGVLPDYIRPGVAELIYRKRR